MNTKNEEFPKMVSLNVTEQRIADKTKSYSVLAKSALLFSHYSNYISIQSALPQNKMDKQIGLSKTIPFKLFITNVQLNAYKLVSFFIFAIVNT